MRPDRGARLRFSRKPYDIVGALVLGMMALICGGIVASFPVGGTGDGLIQPIFTVMGVLCGLTGIEIALDGPTIRWLVNRSYL